MNKVYFILLLIPHFFYGQTSDIVGQAVYTAGQKAEMVNRLNAGQFSNMVQGSNEFSANPNDGKFDWFHDVVGQKVHQGSGYTGEQGWSIDYSPKVGNITDNNKNLNNITDASIHAWLTNDQSKARQVIDLLLEYADADELDFSNGTATHTTNSRHGTFKRFEANDFVNPWFELIAWVDRNLEAYALVRDMNVSMTANERNIINEWFHHANEWAKACMRLRTRIRIGNDWENGKYQNTAYNQFFNAGATRSNPYLEDQNGNPLNTYEFNQAQGLSNVGWEFVVYIGNYGAHFNQSDAKTLSEKLFKFFFIQIMPDGNSMEMVRGYDSRPDWGIFYLNVTLGSIVRFANTHAVAVENGLPGVSDLGKYYEMTVTDGMEDIIPNYATAGTGDGTPKGLLLHMKAISNFFATRTGNGWNPVFKLNNQTIDGANHYHYRNPAAIANAYYNDQNLEDWYKSQGVYSGIPTSGGQNVGSYKNDQGAYYIFGPEPNIWRNMEDHMFTGATFNRNPSVTVVGDSTIDLNLGDTYTEEGATWTDSEDGSGTISTPTTGTVDTNTAGTYTLTYTYTDEGGAANSAVRTVNVIDPNNPPSVSLVGDSMVNLNIGDNYTEEGATWTDSEDGSGTIATPTTGTVDMNIVGTYTLTYTYVDEGGASDSAVRTVSVNDPNNDVPVIQLIGESELNLNVNDTYTELGAVWIDTEDGNGTINTPTTGTVDVSTVGTYTLTYTYTDEGGASDTETRTVTITAVTNDAPVIQLNGDALLNLNLNDTYTELGAVWTDTEDGSGTISEPTSGNVDTSDIGTYILDYSYTDTGGLTTTYSRVIIVTNEIPMTFVDFNNESETIAVGSLILPPYTSGPNNATVPYVWIQSSDPSIAEMQSDGVTVLGLREGVVTLRLESVENPQIFDEIQLIVTRENVEPTFPNILVAPAEGREGENLVFNFELTEPYPETITLDLTLNNLTTSEEDLGQINTSIVFEPNEVEKTFEVTTYKDEIIEEDESFELLIDSKIPFGFLKNQLSVTGTILDDTVLAENDLKLFPIPIKSSNTLTLAGLELETYNLTIYDLAGRLIQSQNLDVVDQQHDFTMPSVSPGIYILKIMNLKTNISRKIIVN